MSNQNKPTRTPPTEPGDWEFTRADSSAVYRLQVYRLQVYRSGGGAYWCRNAENTIICDVKTMPPGYWRRAATLEPFAPVLPLVELWEAEHGGETVRLCKHGVAAVVLKDDCEIWTELWRVIERCYTNLRRTHVCKWEPCDE
jgi:hypothetical protein